MGDKRAKSRKQKAAAAATAATTTAAAVEETSPPPTTVSTNTWTPTEAVAAETPPVQIMEPVTTKKKGKQQQRTLSRMNPNQKEAIIAFMEGHAEILSAAVSRLHPRELVEALWAQLTLQLNELGHVPKTTNTWKKTWFDLRREVKAKLGPPPYGAHQMALPGDMSVTGQRGRIAALMTRAVRICQQHAAASLRGALKQGEGGEQAESAEEEEHQSNGPNMGSPPVVEMSVKCEPPDFAGFDVEELQRRQQQAQHEEQQIDHAEDEMDASQPAKKPREELDFATTIQILATSHNRIAIAMENLSTAARNMSEIFQQRNHIEAEKTNALRQLAQALQAKSSPL